MNEKKQQVMKKAYKLFIEKGFQATSIQDILDYSGISKGTFYNYFSSKTELVIQALKVIFQELEKERDALLVEQDSSNIEIFIKQIELQLENNTKIFPLIEEMIYSNDEEIKQFMKHGQLRMINWLYNRFIEIFGESKEPYLLDCALMFLGILQINIKYYSKVNHTTASIYPMVRYSVARIVGMVEEVAEAEEQLIKPELIKNWLADFKKSDQKVKKELYYTVLSLKKSFHNNEDQGKYTELLDFVLDELLFTKHPRKYLIKSAILLLKEDQAISGHEDFEKLNQLVSTYFKD